jgi:copper chaperone CopZ
MKAVKYLTTGLLTLLLTLGIVQTYGNPGTKSETIKFKVEMKSSDCQSKVQTGLNKTPGVEKAVADLATKTVTITYDPDKTNKDKLVKAVENMGYRTEYTSKDAKLGHDCPDEKGMKSGCSRTCTGDKK